MCKNVRRWMQRSLQLDGCPRNVPIFQSSQHSSFLRLALHLTVVARSLALISWEIIFVAAHICQMPREMWIKEEKNFLKVDRFSILSCSFPSPRFDLQTSFYIRRVYFFLDFQLYCVQVDFFHSLLSHPYTHAFTYAHISPISFKNDLFGFITALCVRRRV